MSKINDSKIGKLQVAYVLNTSVSIPRSMLPKSRAFRRGGAIFPGGGNVIVIAKPAKRKTKAK
ncbi:hypothetical protein [Thauera chlorobenzoica]|nr:hypothetical protein [Thauera chlorobenzoica]SEG30902.1 hypothetical protein SAMN05216242_14011 [Thauera chlorobenzoica]